VIRPRGRRVLPIALSCAALLAAGCSLDYQAAEQMTAEPSEKVPDTVATTMIYRVVKDSRLSLELTAGRAESWSADQRTILSDVSFSELDPDGKPLTSGSAGGVVFHDDTEDAEISGGVQVYSASEQATVETGSLDWKSKLRLLTAPEGETVRIAKDDGSRLEGRGFTGDFRRREFSFAGPVEGTYVQESKE
jgi:LPS export ABC transporter protein LptC